MSVGVGEIAPLDLSDVRGFGCVVCGAPAKFHRVRSVQPTGMVGLDGCIVVSDLLCTQCADAARTLSDTGYG